MSHTPNTLVSGVLDVARLYLAQFAVNNEPTRFEDCLPVTINTMPRINIVSLSISRKYNLKCSLHKCKFFQSKVELLDRIISSDGIWPVYDKVECIKNVPCLRMLNR